MSGLPAPDELLDVSRETRDRLKIFESTLRKWNPKINLVSRNSLNEIWTRHIADSAQVFRVAPPARSWVDMGTGGGFPGLVVAILGAEIAPSMTVTLIESDQRKAAFLRTAVRECQVACKVVTDRIESLPRLSAEVVSARALTDLSGLIAFADHHMDESGVALFPKGVTWRSEVEDAKQKWAFQMDVVESVIDPGAVILKISGISHV